MSITRAKQSSLRTGVTKYDNLRAGLPFTPIIGTATDGGTGSTVSVAFTANNTAGLTYTALSSPGSLTGTSTTSPITVSGLTSGTAYTFQVNAANSAGTSPYSAASNSVTPATPSSYESIATLTSSGSDSLLTFTSIPATYKSLQIRAITKDTSTTSYGPTSAFVSLRFNSTASGYMNHSLYGNGSSALAYAGATSNSIMELPGSYMPSGASYTNMFAAFILDIHDYASTTKNKTVRMITGNDANGNGTTNSVVSLNSGLWNNTAAITSIGFYSAAANFAAGTTFALYGIKG
jgi:hypothetical protein